MTSPMTIAPSLQTIKVTVTVNYERYHLGPYPDKRSADEARNQFKVKAERYGGQPGILTATANEMEDKAHAEHKARKEKQARQNVDLMRNIDAADVRRMAERIRKLTYQLDNLPPPPKPEPLEMSWLIWSNEHQAYWGAQRKGYTKNVAFAGRYETSEARQICSDAAIKARFHEEPIPAELMTPSPETMADLKGDK